MKRNSRTVFALTVMLAAPLLAPALVSRGKQSDSTTTGLEPHELAPSELESSRNRPHIDPQAASKPATPLRFEVFKVVNRKSVTELESRLGADAFAAVLKINRIDKRHIRVGDSLLIPNAGSDLTATAPFPTQLDRARGIAKLVLVSRRIQAFGAYESGRLVRWGPTSTGKKSTPTPAGLYHANWKAKRRQSSVNPSWILPWCFNLDELNGISFHQFDLPGYPASHGCVRLLEDDAKWIYDWVDQWTLSKVDQSILTYGTPVVIFGDYSYGEKPVWKKLGDDPGVASISPAEADGALNPNLATIESKARMRRPTNPGSEIPVATAVVTQVR